MPPCYNYKKERKMADIILQARDLCKSFSSEGVQYHVLNNMDLISIREILQSSWERQARENPHCFTVCRGWTDRLRERSYMMARI